MLLRQTGWVTALLREIVSTMMVAVTVTRHAFMRTTGDRTKGTDEGTCEKDTSKLIERRAIFTDIFSAIRKPVV
ncbi:hypothetical protein [Fowl aviadenovirus A]|nr:hypothetical protein [Fowl aviadenovirus A]QIM58126.1 hypothetical protein [Fowl aviadenovirus A]